MKTVILSVGIIIKVNFNNSIAAFQKFLDKIDGGKITDFLPKLQPLFLQFNEGKLTTEQFMEKVLSILSINKESISVEDFEKAWNDMCEFDESASEIIKLIRDANNAHDKEVKFCIYSDTNPIHVNFLQEKLTALGLEGFIEKIYTTFNYQVSKNDLLKIIIADCRQKEPNNELILVIGNTDKIVEETLRNMAQEKQGAVIEAAQTIEIIKLTEPRLKRKMIEDFLQGPNSSPLEENLAKVQKQLQTIGAGDNTSTQIEESQPAKILPLLKFSTNTTDNLSKTSETPISEGDDVEKEKSRSIAFN